MAHSYYNNIEGLENIFLEDSYVLDVRENDDSIEFYLDLVITKGHPMYKEPGREVQHCYKKAKIVFPRVLGIQWNEKRFEKFTDASGEIDYGNIDEFLFRNGKYYLSGEWGDVEINSKPPKLIFS